MHYKKDHENSCRICSEINDFKQSLFAKKYPNILSQNIFFEKPQIQAMIPIGPLCKGHLLIASKKHEWSFGHLGKNIIPELEEIIDEISLFFKKHYNKNRIILFEHGAVSKTRRGGCCVDHAHMNIMPLPDSFAIFDTASMSLNFMPTKYNQLEDFIKKEKPYLFFWCPHEGSFAVEAPIGSTQFFRKLLVSLSPDGKWDWRSSLYVDTVKSMVTLLKDS